MRTRFEFVTYTNRRGLTSARHYNAIILLNQTESCFYNWGAWPKSRKLLRKVLGSQTCNKNNFSYPRALRAQIQRTEPHSRIFLKRLKLCDTYGQSFDLGFGAILFFDAVLRACLQGQPHARGLRFFTCPEHDWCKVWIEIDICMAEIWPFHIMTSHVTMPWRGGKPRSSNLD